MPTILSTLWKLIFWSSAFTAAAGRQIFIPGKSNREPSDHMKAILTDDTLVLDDAPHLHGSKEQLGILNERAFKQRREADFLADAVALNKMGYPLQHSTTQSSTVGITGVLKVNQKNQGNINVYAIVSDAEFEKEKLRGGKMIAAEYTQEVQSDTRKIQTTCRFKPNPPGATHDCSIQVTSNEQPPAKRFDL